ncbi:hypothetical protein D3C76_1154220 [compost metagenome]
MAAEVPTAWQGEPLRHRCLPGHHSGQSPRTGTGGAHLRGQWHRPTESQDCQGRSAEAEGDTHLQVSGREVSADQGQAGTQNPGGLSRRAGEPHLSIDRRSADSGRQVQPCTGIGGSPGHRHLSGQACAEPAQNGAGPCRGAIRGRQRAGRPTYQTADA